MSYDLVLKAKQALNPLWEQARIKGYIWDPESGKAIGLMLCVGKEFFILLKKEEGLTFHEARMTSNTKLRRQVRKLLQEAGLLPGKLETLSLSGYTWYCYTCDKRGEVDAGLAGEVDSRGEGARDLAIRIYENHRNVSPDCPDIKLEIINPQMMIEKSLMKLISLERK